MEDHTMSLIRKGHAASTRGGFLGVLFSALLALALLHPGAAIAQEVKQIKLTEKHSQGLWPPPRIWRSSTTARIPTNRIRRWRRRPGLLPRRVALRVSRSMKTRR